jgi:hypothetical protein
MSSRRLFSPTPSDPVTVSFSLSGVVSSDEIDRVDSEPRRTCPRCGESCALSDFAGDASKASGRKSHCRLCDAAKSRNYYKANRERVIARVSARQARLRERRDGGKG